MKNPATACCYGRDGNQIYAGGLDGKSVTKNDIAVEVTVVNWVDQE